MADEFRSWAVVEIMGHKELAGFASTETIAGAAMIRVDVPATTRFEGFTKYLSPNAVYAISPCSEETARLRAEAIKKTPFESWSVERLVIADLKAKGKLVEERQLVSSAAPSGSHREPDPCDFQDEDDEDEDLDDEEDDL